jgi:hypothetical protein
LGALPRLLDACAARGWDVGPLGEHGLRGVARVLAEQAPIPSSDQPTMLRTAAH